MTGAVAGRTRSRPPRRNSYLQETGPRCRRSGGRVVVVWRPDQIGAARPVRHRLMQSISLTCRERWPWCGMLLRWILSGTVCAPMSGGSRRPRREPITTSGGASSRIGNGAGTCPPGGDTGRHLRDPGPARHARSRGPGPVRRHRPPRADPGLGPGGVRRRDRGRRRSAGGHRVRRRLRPAGRRRGLRPPGDPVRPGNRRRLAPGRAADEPYDSARWPRQPGPRRIRARGPAAPLGAAPGPARRADPGLPGLRRGVRAGLPARGVHHPQPRRRRAGDHLRARSRWPARSGRS